MKFDEAVKLENFKAHYEVIMRNIAIANSEYEAILIAQAESKRKDTDDAVKRDNLKNEIHLLSIAKEQTLKEIDSRTKEASNREQSSVNLRKDTEEYCYQVQKGVLIAKTQADDERKQTLNDIILLRKEKVAMASTNASLAKQTKLMSLEVESLEKNIKLLRKKENDLVSSIDSRSTSHNKETKEQEELLAKLKREVEQSRYQVLDVDKHFASRERDISRRENDVLVITRRLQQLFQEVKPGIALKI